MEIVIFAGPMFAIGIWVGYNIADSSGNTFWEKVKTYFNLQKY